ncbi:probable LRR receptor-like serine/threonine-protein kinase At1g05700 [Ziziphus jujuba]|uniref:non-specific serine/threonine protein kinase n=1 Tax=Ziziphus jujuba TaxID=326968 RepID=A0ABM4A6C8_ZIZJJ|nr:probable LRR receptor-like serine/threonine-protein kinase At1g05700 [Ziziphus jujuba]
MIMLGTCKLAGFFVLFLQVLVLVRAQDQSGFISIDCGLPGNSSYKEVETGLVYVSDANFINTGESKSISSENKNKYKQHYSFVRTFPTGIRNCYRISNIANGTKYLIRASFVYENYDGLDTYPEFDLHIGANFWDTVNWKNDYIDQQKEIIHVPTQNHIHICLVNKNLGNPFVSSIELRPLSPSYYKTQRPVSLSLIERLDIGPSKGSSRYPEDVHDRLSVAYCDEDWTNISTSSTIEFDRATYRLPSVVMTTAATPKSADGSLEYRLPTDSTSTTSALYYVYMDFAEVEELQANQSREFSIFYDGVLYYEAESPIHLKASLIHTIRGIVGGRSFVISKTANSTLPPLLNAIEVYVVREFSQSETQEGDDDAITKIKSTYGMQRNWQGDPCTRDYLWEGLNCSYDGYDPPRIISVNLSSSGLTGEIPLAISNLTMLEVLDLSFNNFTGPVPEFLSQLPKLRVLNLERNNLNGSLPDQLIKKSEDGSLNLSVDQNPNLCTSVSCNNKKKKNVVVPVVASVVGISVLLLLVTTTCWFLKKKRQHGAAEVENKNSITQHGSFESTNRQFTGSEIQKITNNFHRVLGGGGFGTVYHGYIDGNQVAVKILSPSSVQGYQQFHAEVNLLMRVHHRNLTNLVGYCNDGTNLGLIYEYMANGNLQKHISVGSSRILKWEDRLRIAIEAGQGLEYLHDGCKPPIVHRDVKCTNILLNENFQAKLSDFGLSKMFPTDNKTHISTVVAGILGYLDPEYYITNWLNEKSDVYSFGVVLLEIISSRPAIAKNSDKTHISRWASSMLAKGDITSIVDKRLRGNFETNSVWRAVEIAMACVSQTSTKRPMMNQVVAGLKECLAAEKPRGLKGHETNDSIELMSLNTMSELRPLAR